MGIIASCFRDNTTRIPEIKLPVLKCLCTVNILKKRYSGFFIKINLNEGKNFLFISKKKEEIINLNEIKEDIILIYAEKEKKISLNERFYINLTENKYDIIIIEILPKDKIEESYFLSPDIYWNNKIDELKNKEIEILEKNGEGEKIAYATGKIECIDNNEILYFSNPSNMSPGSPIFLREHNEVLGIIKIGNSAHLIMDIINILIKEFTRKNEEITLDDGVKYCGEMDSNNKPNGIGKYNYPNGESYEGGIINDKFEGKGKYIYSNGEYYEGTFKDGLRYGEGKLYYKNGTIKYEGNFVNDKFEGYGKYIWENGDYYEGEFKEGLNEGKGKEYYKNGTIKYEGDYNKDNYEGKGKYYYEEGDYYEGEFKEGLKNGKGIIYYKNGEIQYDGNFMNGKFEGKGKYIYENGDYYEGEFKNDMCNGKGIEYDKNNNIIRQGQWIDDVFQNNIQ